MKSAGKWLLRFVGLGVLGAFALVASWRWWVLHPAGGEGEATVLIEQGSSPKGIARQMQDQGLVSSAQAFYLLLRLENRGADLKAGKFRLRRNLSPRELALALCQSPGLDSVRVTLPEGWTAKEIAARLELRGVVPSAAFLGLVHDKEFVKGLGLDAPSLEGYLYPDTYDMRPGSDTEEVIRRLVDRWKELYAPLASTAQDLNWTPHQVVTLASIVEKETGAAEERPMIAGVYRRRLDKGMLLQADPTIIYGLKNFDGNIRRKDIRDPHPWNTYVHQGLPPTPICSPGQDAMKAVLFPEAGNTLYFVARGDGTGRHDFSVTYAEHARKVRKYRP